ncbi:hypothetical protein HLB44_35850 [Aquincola sp. S2]|uniref:DUF4165 domain-containing protein n=1 Tax=Pseudaquabacterium terrae TaxID=2732868 RepID=A0ABX2EUQ3_9BURK|nr:hypothetical protein [Aquabacterium terrae]NRF72366.1 hypothetical protein [Aquabacterium terrae]
MRGDGGGAQHGRQGGGGRVVHRVSDSANRSELAWYRPSPAPGALPAPLRCRPGEGTTMKTTASRLALLGALGVLPALLQAQVSTYDAATGVLTIPSVSVGAASYEKVTLKSDARLAFTLQAATPQYPPAPGIATYDAATRLLTLPAVKVGATTYLNVTLRDNGQYRFALQSATPLNADTLAGVKALLAAVDGQFARQVPASGVASLQYADACYLHDGRSRDWLIAETDADPAAVQARDAYRIGQETTNVQVLAERRVVNGDGSTRTEVDVQYEQRFKDGSTDRNVRQTLVTGSTYGTPRCTTPQSDPSWRMLGDQRLVSVAVRARNLRTETYDGTRTPAQTSVSHRREVRWMITDPMGHASYVIVTGPRVIFAGAPTRQTFKFLSPRILRSAPELAGKRGNYLNWRDEDTFRFCDVPTESTPTPAATVDCAATGASIDNWGWTTATPDVQADAKFANLGLVAGATYLFEVYDDDGWKTVNGHAGRAPIATYTAVLDKLPYKFVEMVSSGPQGDRYPRLGISGSSLAQARANAMSAAPAPINLVWTMPSSPDNAVFRVARLHEFFAGPKRGNAAGVLSPGYRYLKASYPGSMASSFSGLPVTAQLPDMASKSNVEFALHYIDRNDNEIFDNIILR